MFGFIFAKVVFSGGDKPKFIELLTVTIFSRPSIAVCSVFYKKIIS
jgi:hypothetical protein